ncbi:hypothetical protein B0H17DRAFT_369003 [Mycena rosella]|uniref:Zn(2)-C6 fungal-type domain-containing protein n=1 Tax=Mycena rosella TaxID=1033263 RepID=A0AAD7H0L9_MYCRO|nr:hypothetical protein B0H17DRAFT_369003 [Mycena rosella]
MACTNCAQACKRCEDTRPCARCVKYSLSETCVDGQRKERKRGVKRGPYKRRARGSDSPPAADSVTDTPAAEGTGSPPGQWTAAHGPPPAPAGAPTPVPLPAPPEGYPHPFYPPMGFVLMPPPPGAEEGAPPVPYFYPYPPFGMYTPPPQPQPAATQNGAEKKANGAAGESDTKDGEGEADAEGDVEGMLSA